MSPNVPCPLGPEEITLPHISNPIPPGQVDLARPWVEVGQAEVFKMLWPMASSNLAVVRIFLIQLFPNWTACSPVTYTKLPAPKNKYINIHNVCVCVCVCVCATFSCKSDKRWLFLL